MTLRAGKFTPELKVEVATRTRIIPLLKAPSTISRSSYVNPARKTHLKPFEINSKSKSQSQFTK